MVVALTPYLKAVSEAVDQKTEILNWVGDLSKERLIGDRVMVATYSRPSRIGSVWMPESQQQEDHYQGVVGLLVAAGPNAFVYDGAYRLFERDADESDEEYKIRWHAAVPKIGDWVIYRPADGFEIAIRRSSCRVFRSECIMGVASDPLYYY